MNGPKAVLWMVLLSFSLLTGWAVSQVGLSGVFGVHESPGGMQVMADLVIALGLFTVWMFRDARERGVNPWPWAVATLFTGSLAPLVYLIRRETVR